MSQQKYLYADASPVSKKDPTGYFSIASVMAIVNILNTISAQPTITYSANVSYGVGLCVRNVANITQYLDWVIPDHHDVKVATFLGKDITGTQISSIVRGFFADDFGKAIAEALIPFSATGGWVPGHVDTDPTPGPCRMAKVDKARYNTVLNRITPNTKRLYHLFKYNCQHWAAEQLK